MKRSGYLAVSAIFILVAVIVTAWLYPDLPSRVPVHWNVHGEPDRYATRLHGAVMPTLMLVGTTLVGLVLPLISPRRFAIKPFARVYFGLMLAVEGFMLMLGVATLLAAAGHAVPVGRVTMLGTGVLLLVLGNYMAKLRKNFFIGIRTPWTLADDDAWERTHRLGGRLFMVAGLLFLAAGVFDAIMAWVPVAAIVIAVVIPVVYSWCVYARRQRRRPGSSRHGGLTRKETKP